MEENKTFNTEKARKFVFYKKLRQHVGKFIRINGLCYLRALTEYQYIVDELALIVNTDKKDTEQHHDLYQINENSTASVEVTIVFRGSLMHALIVDSQVEFIND